RTEHDLGFQTNGKVGGRLEATWHGSVMDPQIFSDAKVTGSIASASTVKQSSLSFSIDATAQVTYDGRKHSAVFHNASLHTSHSNLTLEGGLGRNADLRVAARSDDLREIDLLAVALQTNSSASSGKYSGAPQPLDLAGTADFNGTISGDLDNPRIEGELSGTTLRVRGISGRTFRTSLQLSRSGVTAHQGEIRMGPQAGASFDVSLAL